jgi:hypothetical protein
MPHPWIVASVRSDIPQEAAFTVHAAPDSAPMDSCILTATMGNYIRARRLWLHERIVYSKTLWPDPATDGVGPVGFTPPEFFEESSMCRFFFARSNSSQNSARPLADHTISGCSLNLGGNIADSRWLGLKWTLGPSSVGHRLRLPKYHFPRIFLNTSFLGQKRRLTRKNYVVTTIDAPSGKFQNG